jgi:hypothetical protein
VNVEEEAHVERRVRIQPLREGLKHLIASCTRKPGQHHSLTSSSEKLPHHGWCRAEGMRGVGTRPDQFRLRRCLRELRAAGQTILVIDKYVNRLIAIADRHVIVERGRIAWTLAAWWVSAVVLGGVGGG